MTICDPGGVHFLQVSADTAAGSGSGSAGAAAGGRRLKQAGTPGTATPTKAAATVRTLPAFLRLHLTALEAAHNIVSCCFHSA